MTGPKQSEQENRSFEKHCQSIKLQDEAKCLLLLGDVKNSLYAAIVWWSTKLYAGCSTEKTERGNETGDQEKMGRSWTTYIDQRTFEAVQLPECEANGVLPLRGLSAQDLEERGS